MTGVTQEIADAAVEERSLAELVAADPLSLTREDRRPIIEYYRTKRNLFVATGKVVREPKVKKDLPKIDLDLGDLEL